MRADLRSVFIRQAVDCKDSVAEGYMDKGTAHAL